MSIHGLGSKVIVSFGGGKRGIASAILSEFQAHGYYPLVCHRNYKKTNQSNDHNEIFLDVDDITSVHNALEEIKQLIQNNIAELIILFPTGGSMSSYSSPEIEVQVEAIFRHNYFIPAIVTDSINMTLQNMQKQTIVRTIYLSSAASMHLKGLPHYCAAKSALETFFKSKFRDPTSHINMYLYRLGLIDVDYKYFHEMSINEPRKFEKFLTDNVPSRHFMQPSEVASIIRKTVLDSLGTNGIICDVSGGNSWM